MCIKKKNNEARAMLRLSFPNLFGHLSTTNQQKLINEDELQSDKKKYNFDGGLCAGASGRFKLPVFALKLLAPLAEDCSPCWLFILMLLIPLAEDCSTCCSLPSSPSSLSPSLLENSSSSLLELSTFMNLKSALLIFNMKHDNAIHREHLLYSLSLF